MTSAFLIHEANPLAAQIPRSVRRLNNITGEGRAPHTRIYRHTNHAPPFILAATTVGTGATDATSRAFGLHISTGSNSPGNAQLARTGDVKRSTGENIRSARVDMVVTIPLHIEKFLGSDWKETARGQTGDTDCSFLRLRWISERTKSRIRTGAELGTNFMYGDTIGNAAAEQASDVVRDSVRRFLFKDFKEPRCANPREIRRLGQARDRPSNNCPRWRNVSRDGPAS